MTATVKLLVVNAVTAERDAIADALDRTGGAADIIVGGIGPAASGAATAAALAAGNYDLALCAGIGGGIGPLPIGAIAVAAAIVFADLGAETLDGFLPLGQSCYEVPPRLAVELADCTGGHLGTILTVATVTGTSATAAARQDRHPDAIAEGMEGAGVAAAASAHAVAYAEIRAISNPVGPRDRDAWQIPRALDALAAAVASIAQGVPTR